jgi:hypothetical protein
VAYHDGLAKGGLKPHQPLDKDRAIADAALTG